MTEQNQRLGIALMLGSVLAFSVMDGLSRHLAGTYNVLMVVMIRYWLFAGFVVALAWRQPNRRAAIATRQPLIHLARAALLIAEICLIVQSYTAIGLGNTHAVFACCPLIITALSVPILGERVGWRLWMAIGAGFGGILIILQPGAGMFSLAALLPLASALMFGLYSVLTRLATRSEASFVSLFWSAVLGAILISGIGLWFWQPMSGVDWGWMLAYGSMAAFGNWLLIRCYAVAEASSVQSFAYLQLVFVTAIGVIFFGEAIQTHVVVGAMVVVAAGLITIWQARSALLQSGSARRKRQDWPAQKTSSSRRR